MEETVLGIIGGSGLYALEGLEHVEELRITTPFGEPSDKIVQGLLGGVRLLFLPRHGRNHSLPPHRINFRANILALKQLGAQQLVSVSAVGSLKETLRPGELVVVEQFIDRTSGRASTFFDGDGVVAHVGLADPTDASLSECVAVAAEQADVRVHRGGTYVCIEGPQFSTRAESRLYRSWDADVIGMTNLPEARLAREAELPYASMAWVTDYDCWHETEDAVTVEAVVAILQMNVQSARRILSALAPRLPDAARSPAASALKDALLTDLSAVNQATADKLRPLLGKYLPSTD